MDKQAIFTVEIFNRGSCELMGHLNIAISYGEAASSSEMLEQIEDVVKTRAGEECCFKITHAFKL